MIHLANFTSFLFGTLIMLTCPLPAWTEEGTREVVIRPKVYPHALRNPLKGFRPHTSPRAFKHEYATLTRCYLRWNELENDETDTIDKIKKVCNEKWMDVEKHNIKVIPRVHLDWDGEKGNEYWPADMQTGDYSSEQFKRRVIRLVQRLGQCWDNDPRVAWVQLGIIGYWGEHHHPSPNDEMQKLLGDAFTGAFRNKKVTVRHPWEFTDYEFGIYWDSWAHIQQVRTHGEGIAKLNAAHSRWALCPIGGECAYNWGQHGEQPGDNPNDTLSDPSHLNWLLYTIHWLHCSNLGWVASYDANDPQVRQGAEQVQKAFGYRFILDKVCYPAKISSNRAFTVSFAVWNVGSAPFYYNWPVEVSLLDPKTRTPVWRDTFQDLDIRKWLPGDRWNKTTKSYELRPKSHRVNGTFQVPQSVGSDEYILALAILDPAGMLPSTRFAIENYFKGGRHPIGLVGVGKPVREPVLDSATFDNPAEDRTLQYVLDNRNTLTESPEPSFSLQDAAAIGDIELVRSLLDEGVGVDSWDDSAKKTALQCAAMGGHKDIVELLLSRGARIDAQEDWPGGTALDYATEKGHKEIAELLIAKGADVNAKRGYPTGDTPLHSAAKAGHKDIVELLIAKGADVNAKNAFGETSLHYVARIGRKDILGLLIANEADIDVKNELGQTPLDSAARRGQKEVVKLLIEKGAAVSTIHLAAYSGDLDKIKKFLEAGVDINAKDQDGSIPLVMAVSGGHTELVKYLIDKGADVKATDTSGWTSLHTAAKEGYKHTAEILIANGADVSARNQWPFGTPLHNAAENGHKEIAELLIAKGADVNAKDNRSFTPLHEAVRGKHKDVIALLINNGANVNARARWDYTPMFYAAWSGSPEVIELLIEKEADVNAKDEWDWTPLHYMAQDNYKDMAEFLIAKGADINAEDKWGETPLEVAKEKGHTEIIELLRKHGAREYSRELEAPLLQAAEDGDIEQVEALLSKGADVNTRDWRGTVLNIAMEGGHEPLVKALIDSGANVNATRASGLTTLHYAALYGHKDVAELLIKKGADARARDSLGHTPLHSASSGGHRDVAELLIDKGAEVNAKQKEDRTPLHEAVRWGHADVVELLVSKGADVETQDKDGRNPLWYAKASRNKEIVRLLSQEVPSHDVAVTNISIPASCTQGDQALIAVNVVNRTDYSETLSVILTDTTTNAMVGAKSIHLSPTGVDSMDEVCDMVFPSLTTDPGCFGQYADLGGDVNGDGYNDLIISAPRWNKERGRVYLYYGGPNMDPNPDKIFDGEHDGERFGEGLCFGDLNGDDYDDVILGACKYNDIQGRVYVFYGGTDMDLTCDLIIDGEAGTTGAFGYIIKVGDLDNDGHNDLLVTAPNYTNSWKGRAYLYYGGDLMDMECDKVFEGENANDHFGIDAVMGGDVDDDGYNDILIGAIFYPSRNPEQGRAYLYYGSNRANMDTTPDEVFTCPVSGKNEFGYVEMFDIDNDSHADVLVGARSAFDYRGQVYLYWGSERENMDSIPDKVFAIKEEGSRSLGGNRIHCGYFNDDDYGDIAVAAYMWYRFDHTGRIYLFHGNTETLLDSDPDKIFTGVPLSDFGKFFNIGDLNNDNYSDILAGAWRYNHFQGGAWLYYGGPGDSTQLKFNWDTTNASIGKHILKAEIRPVPGEKDISNNTMTVTVEVKEPSK